MTADRSTYNDIANHLSSSAFPEYAINQVSLPVNAVPLKMGLSSTADTFTVLLRMVYPDYPDQMSDYIDRAPVKALYLSPNCPSKLVAASDPCLSYPGKRTAGAGRLSTALNRLVYRFEK